MSRKKIVEIKRKNGLTQLVLIDIGNAALIASWIAPFVILGIFDAPFFPAWMCYFLWIGLCVVAAFIPTKKKRRGRKFQQYDIRKNDAA